MLETHRFHDISAGHRVYGHENKCSHAHGHNYRIHFYCLGSLDNIGRIVDFSVIKELLCNWLEDNWDHKFLLSVDDPWCKTFHNIDKNGLVVLPFNPTAENIAKYLVQVIGPEQLKGTNVVLHKCTVEETRKCAATFIK